jgi:RNA polymerase sporulation-specific sigma factor
MNELYEKQAVYDSNPELIAKYREGDEVAGERLVEINLPLVYSIAARFRERCDDVSDLIECGTLGLVKAFKTFDLDRGCAFSTYAVPLIFGEIRRFLRDDGSIKVSRGLKEQAAAIKAARNHLLHLFGREPTVSELSRHTGYSAEEIAEAELATASIESIHCTTGDSDFSLENILTDSDSEEALLERIALHQAIETLDERERMVISLRYFHGLTQQRIALILNVSQVQVSRIEKKAIQQLKEYMRK